MEKRMNDLCLTESSMEDSFIYKSFNASNSLITKLVKYISTAVKLDSSYFEEQYMQMKKTSITPLAKNVIEAFDHGDIELLYSRESTVSQSIPFIVRKSEGKVVSSIFISMYGIVDKDGDLNVPVKKLYALMESAYIALELQKNPDKIKRNIGLMKICVSVYTQMLMRILNKEYQLVLDRPLNDKVSYVISRFFLEKIWGYPNPELVDTYASSDLKFIEDSDLKMVKSDYELSNINDLNDLINFIKNLSPRMKDLNARYFIERYVTTYHGAAILSLDYLPYVFFVIVNVLIGSFLIAQPALADVIKNVKNINKFYVELSRIL